MLPGSGSSVAGSNVQSMVAENRGEKHHLCLNASLIQAYWSCPSHVSLRPLNSGASCHTSGRIDIGPQDVQRDDVDKKVSEHRAQNERKRLPCPNPYLEFIEQRKLEMKTKIRNTTVKQKPLKSGFKHVRPAWLLFARSYKTHSPIPTTSKLKLAPSCKPTRTPDL